MVVFAVQPTLMARIALAYPKPPKEQDQGSKEEGSKKANGKDSIGAAKAADVESGANGTSDI